jgi:glutaredoxin
MADPKEPRVILYFAEWCGHCKTFKPEWKKLMQELDKKGIKYKDYEDSRDEAIIQSAGVKGYPTIKIDGKEYNGTRTAIAIMEYLFSDSKDEISKKYDQCGGGNKKFGVTLRSMDGGSKEGKQKDEYYKIKYLKYKAKYMLLRSELGI